MLANIIIGAIFFGIIGFSTYKTIKGMRNNSCQGCSFACSKQMKKNCKH